jgi:uncharacterized protein
MHDFLLASIGGGLIGFAASMLLFCNGRIAGISGITGSLLFNNNKTKDVDWKWAFLGGLLASGVLLVLLSPESIQTPTNRDLIWMPIAGVIVGFGTRMGNGCTSGHGVCGISRFSVRSILATVAFLGTGMLVATVIQMTIGG